MIRRVGRACVFATVLVIAAGTQTRATNVRVIGTPGNGCIAGAAQLPDGGVGFLTIRRPQSAFWGHPDTIAALEELGRRAREAGLPDLYIGDIAARRGGRLAGGHVSHQLGLDADVWLDLTPRDRGQTAARDSLTPPSLVRADGRDVDPAFWRPEHMALIRMATELPGVDRVLVNAAIKKHLCATAGADRAWLRLVRPWWGHASHMHISFRCPADQPACDRPAPPLPSGDGCDATLAWWFTADAATPPAPRPPAAMPAPPPACRAILLQP